jgi:ABC-type dipeptide/oligopeptide/nickel transport system permease component
MMLRLVTMRVAFMGLAALLVVSLSFAMFHLIPGDPAVLIAGDNAPQETVESVRQAHGFDQPPWVQFARYVGKLAGGDLGVSIYTRRPVMSVVIPAFLNTIQLAVLAMLFALATSVPLGCVAALWRYTVVDRLISGVSLIGVCTPIFLLALFGMYVFSVRLRLLPMSGMASWHAYILPVLTLTIYQAAFLTRITAVSMVDALRQKYVTGARAKGASEARIVFAHALRNALLPIITIAGLRFGYTLGGAAVTEVVFGWPGLGRVIVDSILTRDLPLTQGALLLFALAVIAVNLAVDVLCVAGDPRLRYG